jgi:hypothetical protein
VAKAFVNYVASKIEKQRREQDRKAEKAEKMAAKVQARKLARLQGEAESVRAHCGTCQKIEAQVNDHSKS